MASVIVYSKSMYICWQFDGEHILYMACGSAFGMWIPDLGSRFRRNLELWTSDQISWKLYLIRVNSSTFDRKQKKILGVVTNPHEGCGGGRFWLFGTVVLTYFTYVETFAVNVYLFKYFKYAKG